MDGGGIGKLEPSSLNEMVYLKANIILSFGGKVLRSFIRNIALINRAMAHHEDMAHRLENFRMLVV